MAIKALAWMVRVFEPPVYCYHEIVHNRLVVEEFRAAGRRLRRRRRRGPAWRAVMLSAHGSAPEVEAGGGREGRIVVDACCPLVTKVHHELKVRARKGYTVLYVGHAGHEEAIGTMAVAPEAVHLVEHEEDLDAARARRRGAPVALLAQTTLAHDEWEGIVERARERYPELWMPGRSDLCYATTNRQSAVKAVAPRCDAMVVLGSANSSNTVALAKVAPSAGCATCAARQLPERGARDLDRRRRRHRRRLRPGLARRGPPRRAWPGTTASRSCTPPTRTSTSLPAGARVSCCAAWRRRRA